jgi:hypothetical protein
LCCRVEPAAQAMQRAHEAELMHASAHIRREATITPLDSIMTLNRSFC